MLTFTRDDLAQALIAKKAANKKVRIVWTTTRIRERVCHFEECGVDVLLKASSMTGLLHHKYAVIDADIPSEGNVVVRVRTTGRAPLKLRTTRILLFFTAKGLPICISKNLSSDTSTPAGRQYHSFGKANHQRSAASYELQQNYPNPFQTVNAHSILDRRRENRNSKGL